MLTKFSPYSSYFRVEATTEAGMVSIINFFRVRSLIYSDVPYQWDDDLTVAAGGEGVLRGELLPDLLVVVNLSVGLFIDSTGTQLENVWQ
jgi:hypothetical protein